MCEGTGSAIRIRCATVADLEQTARLVLARIGGEVEHWVERLEREVDGQDSGVWVAVQAGHVLGYGRVGLFRRSTEAAARTAPSGYYLGGLFVAEQVRSRGLGRQITQVRLDWIARRASTAWYFTNARNAASLRLHAALGFQEVTRDFHYPGVEFDGGVGVLCKADLAHGPRERLRAHIG